MKNSNSAINPLQGGRVNVSGLFSVITRQGSKPIMPGPLACFDASRCSKRVLLRVLAVGAGIAFLIGGAPGRPACAQAIQGIDARVVAVNIPGASAISQ